MKLDLIRLELYDVCLMVSHTLHLQRLLGERRIRLAGCTSEDALTALPMLRVTV